ncbi:hypothetical protein [Methylobacterium komagatae]
MLANQRAVFPEVPVRMLAGAPALPEGGPGALMTAVVHVAQPKGHVIGHRVFAHAAEIPFLDLATLRHRGRETRLTDWAPVQPGAPRIGATLRAATDDGPETLEVTDCLPTYEAA